MQVTTVGIDLAKNVFYLHGCDVDGKAVVRNQFSGSRIDH
jgi:transposase